MENTMTYQEQAEQFLKTTGTKIKFTFIKHDYHFQGDDKRRDIWRVTLSRNREGINTGIKINKKMSIRFGQSLANTGEQPTAYDVLTCLTKAEYLEFDQFCGDFGYSTDSIQALKVFKAVQREWCGVNRVFGDVLEQLQEIN